MVFIMECKTCNGFGYLIYKAWRMERQVCPECKGRGFIRPWPISNPDYSNILKQDRGKIKLAKPL